MTLNEFPRKGKFVPISSKVRIRCACSCNSSPSAKEEKLQKKKSKTDKKEEDKVQDFQIDSLDVNLLTTTVPIYFQWLCMLCSLSSTRVPKN